MKSRLRKKFRGLKCRYLYDEYNLMTTDPIPYYERELYCKLNPSREFPDGWHTLNDDSICCKCKMFCPSRKLMKDFYRWERDAKKEDQRYFQKHPQVYYEAKKYNFRINPDVIKDLDLL